VKNAKRGILCGVCGRSRVEDLAVVATVKLTVAEPDPGVTLAGEKLQVDCDGKLAQAKVTDAAKGPNRGAAESV
jgi:hypothetical protein